jgi:hypothetical protein
MSNNGKGSARRGTSKEEMKRFEDNYDSIFKKEPVKEVKKEEVKEICMDCEADAVWYRRTQFAGDHPYCDLHAKLQKDFQKEDGYMFWQTVKDYLKSRK